MSIPLQLLGTIETTEGIADSMLCIDIDRPDEAMLHWWGKTMLPGAALVKLKSDNIESIDFEPLLLYKTTDKQGIYLSPPLSQPEYEDFKGYSGKFQKYSDFLEGEWNHVLGKKGRIFFSSPESIESVEPEICTSWEDFKIWANRARYENNIAIFRGHGSNHFPLKTTLHRVGRHRLERYCTEILREFRMHAEAISGVRFDMSDGENYASLLGLARHHGLPTPLLDWTCSPYIAAFFAFADAIESYGTRTQDTHVRIYGLTQDFVSNWAPESVILPYISPYIAYLDISPRNNPRLYAQQGRFLVTNISDVEHFLCDFQKNSGKNLLFATDVPIDCAIEALEELQFMGLTAATMFPGLDGVCRKMKHAMSFKHQT